MRAVVQRVSEASVTVGGDVVGRIDRGLLVLLGVAREDDVPAARRLAGRIVGLRLFDDAEGRMGRSVAEAGGALLVVSQFTLWGDTAGGRRPSWSRAAPAAVAEPLYREFVTAVRDAGVSAAEGRFGATMQVALVNDGPVTILVDTEGRF